jgi:hypothetical protein
VPAAEVPEAQHEPLRPSRTDAHPQIAADRIHQALDVVDNDSVTVFGTPGRITRRLLDQIWAAGVRVTVNSSQLGGFHRLTAD